MTLYGKLLEREAANNPIKVGVIGAGQMGAGMIAQISTIPGMEVRGISDIQLESAKRAADAYNDSSAKKVDIQVTTDFKEVIESDDVEIIVDATGVPEVGAKIALATLMTKKHLVLLNVEVDITIGPLMKKMYDAAVSMVHPVTGLFPYANAGELFVYLGIANGVVEAGYSQGSLAVRYFLAGIVVIFIRGVVTERITKFLMKRAS